VFDDVEGANDLEAAVERRGPEVGLYDGCGRATASEPQSLGEQVHADDTAARGNSRQRLEYVARAAADLEHLIAGTQLTDDLFEDRGDDAIASPEPKVTILDREQRGEELSLVSDGFHDLRRYSGTDAGRRKRAGLLTALVVFCFAFYGLTGTGHSSSGDGFLIFLTARNLFNRADLAVQHVYGTDQLRREGVDGRLYAKFGPGMVIAHMPMLAAAKIARHFSLLRDPITGTQPKSLREDEFWVQLTNAWIVAVLVALVFVLCGVFGADARSSLVIALLVALASPLWLYARVDATEGLQALGLTGATYCLARGLYSHDGRPRDLSAGAFFAIAIVTKIFNVVLIPAFLLFYAITWRRRAARGLVVFLIPVAVAIALHAGYNFVRFGSPFDTGYDLSDERFNHALLPGVLGMLFSPCYGLLLFWPAVVVATAGARRQFTSFPEVSVLAVSIFLTLLCIYAMWWAYQGIYYGPRFVVPAIPLLAPFALPVVRSATRRAKAALVAVFLLGFSVQALAATTSHWQQIVHGIFWSIECKTREDCLDNPYIAPLRVAAWYLEALYWRNRLPERSQTLLREPPWRDAVPWRNPDEAVDKVAATLGIDFWAAPESWRLKSYFLWAPGGAYGIPSSRVLATMFLVMAIAAAAPLGRLLVAGDKSV